MRLSVRVCAFVSPGALDVRDITFCAGGREPRPTVLGGAAGGCAGKERFRWRSINRFVIGPLGRVISCACAGEHRVLFLPCPAPADAKRSPPACFNFPFLQLCGGPCFCEPQLASVKTHPQHPQLRLVIHRDMVLHCDLMGCHRSSAGFGCGGAGIGRKGGVYGWQVTFSGLPESHRTSTRCAAKTAS